MVRVSMMVCLLIGATAAQAADSEWKETELKASTLEKVYKASAVYQRCIGEQFQASAGSRQDSRALTDAILKKCEPQLQPMRDAFIAEKVPADQADRYLKQTRTRAARNLIKQVMAGQAMMGPR